MIGYCQSCTKYGILLHENCKTKIYRDTCRDANSCASDMPGYVSEHLIKIKISIETLLGVTQGHVETQIHWGARNISFRFWDDFCRKNLNSKPKANLKKSKPSSFLEQNLSSDEIYCILVKIRF